MHLGVVRFLWQHQGNLYAAENEPGPATGPNISLSRPDLFVEQQHNMPRLPRSKCGGKGVQRSRYMQLRDMVNSPKRLEPILDRPPQLPN